MKKILPVSLRRLGQLLLVGGLLLSALTVQAANWPTRPLTLIVPFPPGGAADTIGRHYAERLALALGQPVVVENRPGAGTAIAAEAAARANPDGYTLSLATAGQLTILPNLQHNLRFDPLKDYAPVSVVGSVPNVIAINDNLAVNSLPELIAAARANPGGITYSSCGNGTLCHLSGELFKTLSGTDLLHVPYAGSAPAIAGLLGKQVDVAVDTLTILGPQIRAGRVKGLALSTAERSPLLPEVPTAAEVGLEGFVVSGWFGIVAPAATPRARIERLNREIRTIAESSLTAERFGSNGITVEYSTPEAFAEIIAGDHARWASVIRDADIRIE